MNYKFLILGTLGWIVAIWIFPFARKRINEGELNHLTVKGIILPVILFIMGLYFIARELSKIL
ncbi:hypothetical protein [Croceitalea rosinachiae]|uniref:Integral membrane protein n=1 Tax=Croceitalea rosinachiae TaxID=3075596 RepID=A0ABU3ACY9_9FLAO|nr:hypothetical protein [Croceitalea sp. F388]MDT0608052.1 hypothetical protein [Croceitalea sp. F388]